MCVSVSVSIFGKKILGCTCEKEEKGGGKENTLRNRHLCVCVCVKRDEEMNSETIQKKKTRAGPVVGAWPRN